MARTPSTSRTSAATHAAIADTGALVALLDRAERHHGWAAERIREMEVPLLICDPVLTEAMHLLAGLPRAQHALFGLLENGALRITFRIPRRWPTYPGELLREVIPGTGKTKTEIVALLRIPASTFTISCRYCRARALAGHGSLGYH